ncbi:MAG: hypothetical protein LRY53_08405 [Burkholderiaceae bacterium]|nr:hypothetical protein [Burkholderiaceae bacterium]MCD8565641.1 hypothetical protein [Burkholderiaceae bacterium]
MSKKKKSQPQSAVPFFIMAVFAFLAGFPIWLVLILALLGVLVLKLEKDKKALSNLPPLPAAESADAQSSSTDSSDSLAGPFGRPIPAPAEPAPVFKAPAPQTYREPIEAPEPPPWISPDYQPYPVSTPDTRAYQRPVAAITPKSSTQARASNTIDGNRSRVPGTHPLVKGLRTRQGARQAIIAMTVLGPPRALQPYEFDPIQQSDVAPARPS